MNNQFSFIILTYNEEVHLPRLLQSIKDLDAPIYILDSGSTDKTLQIAADFGAGVLQHPFENHPKQWDFALKNFPVKTPWVVCLDADQTVTPELKKHLSEFRNEDNQDVDGIYFNRKNFFKGKWIKHGGYFPFYLLKMIRYGVGYSDLNENMDHRFIVTGKTTIWKDCYLLEENLKENQISFWINKHNRYSELVAQEEVERMLSLRQQTLKPNLLGSPDERTAWLKQIWWRLPRYLRPVIYFTYRIFFQLGFLDGREGIIFHFLQGFWFRMVVDIKIEEIMLKQTNLQLTKHRNNEPLKFVFTFIALFALFYYFNIGFFNITTPTSHHYYSPFLANNLNYIAGLRHLLLFCSAQVLHFLGYAAIFNNFELLVAGRGKIELVYLCLGLGVMSFFSAFVIAYPKKTSQKIVFFICGNLVIQLLNILRFLLLSLFWNQQNTRIVDHHTLFNITIYILIAIALYFWVKHDSDLIENAAN